MSFLNRKDRERKAQEKESLERERLESEKESLLSLSEKELLVELLLVTRECSNRISVIENKIDEIENWQMIRSL